MNIIRTKYLAHYRANITNIVQQNIFPADMKSKGQCDFMYIMHVINI